ncbi:sensor histidine kinase [Paenibacillus shenyangensis]|uniref:sensor histidine kinase n=1 Tax=Paenibacillus sp. A9 TaxID=1284352 RepID=UPI00035E20E8|nr:HAMP domain-containing sensor histidine kinase [Paenibacillus sp. A9]
MKNIYSQLVLTFILVIVASFVVTLLLSDWVFQRQQVNFVEDRILTDARAMADIQSSLPESMIQKYLDSQGGQLQIVVVGENGAEYRSTGDGPGGPPGLSSSPSSTDDSSTLPSLTAQQSDKSESFSSPAATENGSQPSTDRSSSAAPASGNKGNGNPPPGTDPAGQWVIPEQVQQLVLKGQTYHPANSQDNKAPGVPSLNFFLNTKSSADKTPRYVGVPFERNGEHYALFVRPSPGHFVNQFNNWMILVLSVMLVTGVMLFLFAARLIARPINKLSEATRLVAKGDYSVRVNLKRRDEIGELGNNFNQMTSQLSKIEAMRQEFVSNVSHEIQTPLTSIRGFAGALRDSATEEQVRHLQIIEQESERLSKLSSNLLKLASLDVVKLNTSQFRLDEQIRMSVVSCVPMWMAKQIDLSADLDKIQFTGDEDLLSQVWMNLLSNAIKFTPDHGNIYITLTQDEQWIQVSVQDTGCGITEEHRQHIFERFYKADTSRNSATGGNGLGLSIVHKIVSLHGGHIEVDTAPEQGTIMRVYLPRDREADV